jgi:hypothetical protein
VSSTSISSSEEFEVDRRGVIDGELGYEAGGVLISNINERVVQSRYLHPHYNQTCAMSERDQQSRSDLFPSHRIYLAGQPAMT